MCGNTEDLKDLIDKKRYLNIKFPFSTFKSKNIMYVDEFIKLNSKHNFNLVEVHNRPSYVRYFYKKKARLKICSYFSQ